MADRRLQVLHAVAKHLCSTKAAETLFMPQPAISFQIKRSFGPSRCTRRRGPSDKNQWILPKKPYIALIP